MEKALSLGAFEELSENESMETEGDFGNMLLRLRLLVQQL